MGCDKALVDVGGASLAKRVHLALAAVVDAVIVVGKVGERNPLPDLPFVTEDHPDRCALAGVVAALREAGGRRVLVVGCDQPFLTPAVLAIVARLGGRAPVRLPRLSGHLEPLLACWDSAVALSPLVARLHRGALSLRDAIDELEPEIITEESLRKVDPDLLAAVNVNTPADLRRARTVKKY